MKKLILSPRQFRGMCVVFQKDSGAKMEGGTAAKF